MTDRTAGRVGQSRYWAFFGANMLLVPLMLGFGLYQIITGSFASGIVTILLIAPLGLYFRVIMMRRCRDIGWPAFLPWAFFGAQFFVYFAGPAGAMVGGMPSMSVLLLPMVLGLADFVFTVVLGCMRSRHVNYAPVFDDGAAPMGMTRPLTASPAAGPALNSVSPALDGPDLDRFDAAIARALAAQRDGGAPATAGPAPAPAGMTRPASGFGRKGL
jgi:uncharacterized membrane protein YhaH (DUF805 family)